MNKPKAIICEIDGVLADHRHRLHFVDLTAAGAVLKRQNTSWPSFCRWIEKENREWRFDWDSFYAAMDKDEVNEAIDLIASAAFWYNCSNDNGVDMLFVTGRPERFREQTEKWLAQPSLKWEIKPEHGTNLFMRPDFIPFDCPCRPPTPCYNKPKPDHRPSHVIKKEIYEREIAGKYNILFALENDDACIEMYGGLGLTCLKVCLP